ncbi:MAG TPA: MarR family transcriptional regulator [Streptosporangiaceae bacterium]
MGDDEADPVAAVERAMVVMRRSQTRRALAQLSGRGTDPGTDVSGFGALDAVESGARTVTDVARALGVDQPRASRLVARAVGDGLLVRAADQRDGRRALLDLTAEGRRLLARAHRFRQGVAARAMDDWSAAERAAFAGLLTRFVAGFARATGGPPSGADNDGDDDTEGR